MTQPRANLQHNKVAIIGAGMSGLSAARHLAPHCDVKIFDKSRGIGGRMSTRYVNSGQHNFEFDHGAQYFTARDKGFQAVLKTAVAAGAAGPWAAKALYSKDGHLISDTGGDRFVGTPRMNSLPKFLSEGLDISLGRRVAKLSRDTASKSGDLWTLGFDDAEDESGFSAIILTVPPVQARALLPEPFLHASTVAAAKMQACFALMIGLQKETTLKTKWGSLRGGPSPLAWSALNSSKPGRQSEAPCLVIHADGAWSETHQNADKDWVQSEMLNAGSQVWETDLSRAPHIALHRWLYAAPETMLDVPEGSLFDAALNIAVCGDWCAGGRVEGAWLSGQSAARHVMAAL